MADAAANRSRLVWLLPLVALAAGFVAGRHRSPDMPAEASTHDVAAARSVPRAKSPTRERVSPAAAAPTAMPATPAADLPLADSFDALAARARGGDASASMRLLRDMRRCQQRGLLETVLALPELRPAEGDELPPELRETRNARLAEQKRVRADAQRKLAASEALCDGVTPAELATLGEWLERAADSGDPGAEFCYLVAATSNGFAPADRYSDAWVEWMKRYRSKAYAYSERAFAAGYAMASVYLYDVAAGPYISTPAFPLDPDLPPDSERAYGFALMHIDLIERGASPFSAEEEPAWRESAETLRANLDAGAVARAQAWAEREAARVASSTPPAPPCTDDADSA